MGDGDPIQDEDLAFDLVAAKAALQRKVIKPDCPFCGENNWAIPEGSVLLHGGTRPDGTIDMELGALALSVICVKCGYVRMHHLYQLLHGE